MSDNRKEIMEYLKFRWEYLGTKNWQPKCGFKTYARRNYKFVLENLKDDPDYLKLAW